MATSESMNGAVAPVQQNDRIEALDILRGIAVLGILLMNIVGFGLPWAYDNPTVAGGMDPPNYWAWAIPVMFFEGTMRGIFSLLFGASIVLLTDRMERSGAGLKTADVHFRRMMWMMLFGIIHWALLLWIGEILFAYSIGGLLLFVFRKMAPKLLLMIAGALLLTSVVTSMLGHQSLLETSEAAKTAEAAKNIRRDPDQRTGCRYHRMERGKHRIFAHSRRSRADYGSASRRLYRRCSRTISRCLTNSSGPICHGG